MAYTIQWKGGLRSVIGGPDSPLQKPTLPYRDKIAELRKMRDVEVIGLQDIIIRKETNIKDLRSIGRRKNGLLNKISQLEAKLQSAQEVLSGEIEKRSAYITSSKHESKLEEERYKNLKAGVEVLSLEIENMENIARELHQFVEKEQDARIRFVTAKTELEKAEREKTEAQKESKEIMTKLNAEKRDVDHSKSVLTDLSGRLTMYAHQISIATEKLNKNLNARRIPIIFEWPKEKVENITKIKFQ